MTDLPDTAMIFAAGHGTRMRHLTENLPKPMVELSGRPMIDYAIDLVRDAGVSRLVANVHYLAEKIAPHLEAQSVIVSHETTLLETGGGLVAARELLQSNLVITINPDVVWGGRNPVEELRAAWRPHMQALLLLTPSKTQAQSGDFSLEQGEIRRKGPFTYTGAQVIRLDHIGQISQTVFSLNAYWDLLADRGPINGIVHDGSWGDIGTPEGLRAAELMMQRGPDV